jgi:hypothetical protein
MLNPVMSRARIPVASKNPLRPSLENSLVLEFLRPVFALWNLVLYGLIINFSYVLGLGAGGSLLVQCCGSEGRAIAVT